MLLRKTSKINYPDISSPTVYHFVVVILVVVKLLEPFDDIFYFAKNIISHCRGAVII